MVDTALTLITDALLDLGVLADEETPSASMAAGGLRKLNNMIGGWNIEGLLTYGATANTLSTVANQAVYTIGPSGNLNIPYPDNITAAFVRDTSLPVQNQVDYPLYIFNDTEWANNPIKSWTAAWPNLGIWFNYTYPLVQAYLSPIPTGSQYEIIIWTSGILTDLTLATVITMPAGYKRAYTANLAIEMAPSYGVEPAAAIVKIAQDSKARLKIKNLQINPLTPNFVEGWYDIRTNRYLI